MKRTYKRRWHLGRGQRRGFFPIAAPLVASLAGSVAEPILGKVVKKIIGWQKKSKKT